MNQAIITAEGLGKAYACQSSQWQRLFGLLTSMKSAPDQWALHGVNFALSRGQSLGLVGDNGAGKSTLLKLVAGTLQPTVGSVVHAGRLTAILELGAGFHPEFTGRQNLYFGGALIGIQEPEMRALEAEIIAFSELEHAIDRPVKTYSSGMAMRLAFSLVTAVEPDILIIDEALAVGDQHFQRKCIERIDAFRSNGCTILFCSHSLFHVRQLCDQVIWIDRGEVRALGATEDVLAGYETHVRNQIAADHRGQVAQTTEQTPFMMPAAVGGNAKLISVDVQTLGKGMPPLLVKDELRVTITAYAPNGERPNMAMMLERSDKVCITSAGTDGDVKPKPLGDGFWRASVVFPDLQLYSGEYMVSAYLFDETGTLVYEEWLACQRFTVVRPMREIGMVRLPRVWS